MPTTYEAAPVEDPTPVMGEVTLTYRAQETGGASAPPPTTTGHGFSS